MGVLFNCDLLLILDNDTDAGGYDSLRLIHLT